MICIYGFFLLVTLFLVVLMFKHSGMTYKENMIYGWIFFIFSAVDFGCLYIFDFGPEIMCALSVILVPFGAGCGLCISNIQKWRRERREED